jgi:hypothetical protein
VIPARSDNDTSNNPHNPMYGIAQAGAKGSLLSLTGTRNSDSGGRSMPWVPGDMLDLSIRPTKVDSPEDATGLVDTGDLGTMMPDTNEAGRVMQAIEALSANKIIDRADAIVDPEIQKIAHCSYLKTTDTVTNFGDISAFDPLSDDNIIAQPNGNTPPLEFTNATVGVPAGLNPGESIFTSNELSNNGTLRKTASIMKLVVNGLAGAGTIESGGYDYHNGTRSTGERRDFIAGQAIGACLEYASRARNGAGIPIMVYVFTDGSLASNGRIDMDDPDNARGKGEWTGDNSSTSAAFFLVFDPNGRPALMQTASKSTLQHQQLGWMRDSGSVETNNSTPGANAVNLLAQMCVLNYMALHDEIGQFDSTFDHGLSDVDGLEGLVAFQPIVTGTIS